MGKLCGEISFLRDIPARPTTQPSTIQRFHGGKIKFSCLISEISEWNCIFAILYSMFDVGFRFSVFTNLKY